MKGAILLPRWLRIPAYLLLAAGIAMLVMRFYYGIKPAFLEIKVFAIYSVYLDAKSMTVIQNQVAEELGALMALAGLFLLAFTKEVNEDEEVNAARLRSFFIAAYSTVIFLALAILFTYGLGFAYMMVINLFFWLAAYIIAFRYLRYQSRKRAAFPNPKLAGDVPDFF